MYMFPVLLFFIFGLTRTNSAYHPHLLFRRYVIVKNKTIAKLFISQTDPAGSTAKNAQANRNKLSFAGIVFYGLFLLLIIISTVLFLLPDIPAENFVFDSRYLFLAGNTLNEKLPVTLAFALLFAECAFHFLNTLKYSVEKTTAKKTVCVLYYLIAALGIIGTLGSLWLAINTIIESI